jgi:phage tail protein X
MHSRSSLNLVKNFLPLFCLLAGLNASAQTNTPRTVTINNNCGGFLEYLPASYSTDVSKKYPTIIYIHGGASFGSGSASNLANLSKVEGVPLYISKGTFPTSIVTPYGDTTSFIAISPQFARPPSTPQDVKAVIDYVLSHYRVDLNRLYLTGYSLGGNAVWQAPFNLAAAQRLAAMVPVSGYNYPYYDTTAKFIAGANIPVWAIHSNADQTAPVSLSVNMVSKINSYNPTVPAIITRLTTQSHDSSVSAAYNPTFRPNGKNIYEWMLQYAKAYPPIANAGNDTSIVLPVNSVTVSGSRSAERQGAALTYLWTKATGPAQYSISDTKAVTPVITGLVAGTYSFKLTVTNTAGLSATDTVKVFVVNPNASVPPVASAGSDTSLTLPKNSLTLNAAGSYAPNGAIQSYGWSQLSGPAQAVIEAPGGETTLVSNLKTGTYQFVLKITDNLDNVGKDTVRVRVINPFRNVAPVARAGADQTISLPVNSVVLNGSASSDTDGVIRTYQWRQLNGPSQQTFDNASAASATTDNLVAGVYQFQLTVQDDSSAYGRDTLTVFVNPLPKLVQVNVYGGSFPAGTGWNNWNVQSSLTSAVFKYTDGTTSLIKAVLGGNSGVSDNGATYPVTMCPLEVGRTTSYFYTPRSLVISGLDSNSKYNFEVYATRTGGPPTNTFSIGSTTINIAVNNNYSAKGLFTNLSPVKGAITVNISGQYNYLNGFTLTETGSATSGKTNKSPVAIAGADQSIDLPVSEVTVNGAGSYDPDGSIAGYSWQQLSGPNTAVIATPTLVSTQVAGLDSGLYVLQLTVTDNQGAVSATTMKITVGTQGYNNIAPIANAGPDVVIDLPLDSVQLNGSASKDPDGTITRYSWSKIDGPAQYRISNTAIVNPVVSNLFAGTYRFGLTVADNFGITAKDTVSIEVTATTPVPPVANAGTDITLSMPVNFTSLNGAGSYHKGSGPITYYWHAVDGPGPYTIDDSTVVDPKVSDLTDGAYTFELVVTDDTGLTGKDSVIVTVKPNLPPVANAGNDTSLVLPVNSVQLNGAGSTDPDGSLTTWHWTKVSGPTSFSIYDTLAIRPVISKLTKGIYVFSLQVTDNLGATAESTVTITVYPPLNTRPIANAGPDQSIILPATTAVLNGSASADNDGLITVYAWRQLNGPSTISMDSPGNVSTNAANLVAGSYSIELTVTDDSMAVAKDTVTITVSTGQRLVKVNIYGGSFPAGTGWNNWNVASNLTSARFNYTDGTTSAITAVLSANTTVADNGATYSTTMCPMEVGRSTSYFYTPRTLVISGLDGTKRYTFEIYSSRNSAYNNTFTVNNMNIVVNPTNNFTSKVIFSNITPATGKITLSFTGNGSYNYINGFTLTENAVAGSSLTASGSLSANFLTASDTAGVLMAFPNPFRDHVQVQVDNNHEGQLKITLVDQSSRVLKEYAFVKASGPAFYSIPVQELSKGIYYIQVQMAAWHKTIAIMKHY